MSMEMLARSSLYKVTRGANTKGGVSRGTLRRVVRLSRKYRGKLSVFVLLSVVSAVLTVAAPLLAGQVVDAIVAHQSFDIVLRLSLLIAVVALLDAALSLSVRWFSSTIGEGLIQDLRVAVFDHVQRMPVAFFTRTRTGALVSRLNSDVVGAQSAFAGTLSSIVTNVVALTLTVIVMLGKSWLVTVLALILLPLFLIPARLMGGRLAAMRREAAEHNASMSTQMTERFSAPGATLIKLFGRPNDESREFDARVQRVRDIGVRSSMYQSVFLTSLTLVSALALALVYGVGGWLALQGGLGAGDVVVLALLLTRLYGPLTGLSNARVDIMSALVSFDRVFEILDLKPLIEEPVQPQKLPEGPLGVRFDDVVFAYPSAEEVSLASLEDVAVLDSRGGEEVLHGISFEALPGQTVAVVGSSGAGKSTIAQLLARLYDVNSGAVRIGDIHDGGGQDVRDLAFADLHSAVGMVTQDGHLFHESIGSNLRLARPDASDEQLWDALRQARLEDMVSSLPDGLDTIVGERGYRLSGGERQRLTIARLLVAAPRIVILDEATAALDSSNEAAVQEALGAALSGRTAVVIAHRLSTIRNADQILVVEAGEIVERGTHTELLARDGRYAELYTTQFAEASAVAEDSRN